MKPLNEAELDALKEVGNIGAGNAATAMAEMTSMKIDITVPQVLIESVVSIPDRFGGKEKLGVGINFGIEGDMGGYILLILPMGGAFHLIDMMMFMDAGTTQEIDEMGQSALMELGNILSSSYLNALSGLTGTYLLPSPPDYNQGELGNIIDTITSDMNLDLEKTIFVETEFTEANTKVSGGLVFLLNPDSLTKLFEILGL